MSRACAASSPRRRREPRPCLRARYVALLLVASAGRASAAQSSDQPVVVHRPACLDPPFPFELFLDSLRVELAGRPLRCCSVASDDPLPATPPIHVRVEFPDCSSDTDVVLLSVVATGAATTSIRELSFSDVLPSARPRALALAAAEQIHALGREPAAEPPGPPVVEPVRPARSTAFRGDGPASSIAVRAEARTFPSHDTTAWGGRLSVSVLSRRLYLALDGGVDFASKAVSLGTVSLRTASGGLSLGPRFTTQAAIVSVGVRGELGWGWVNGESTAQAVHTGSGGGLLSMAGALISIAAPPTWRLRPQLALEAGAVIAGLAGRSQGAVTSGQTALYLLGAFGFELPM